jgi:hypothetical protein
MSVRRATMLERTTKILKLLETANVDSLIRVTRRSIQLATGDFEQGRSGRVLYVM